MDDCLLDNCIMILEKIGSGNFSNIFKGVNIKNNKTIAIKKIKNKNSNCIKEIDIMKLINHENIIRYHFYIKKNDYLYLILEYCDTDLSKYLKLTGALNETKSLAIFRQLKDGFQYLYYKNIIHRDLKPSNILITQNMDIKICDFGFACYFNEINDNIICGSPFYMAPEILKKQKYNNKIDLWSLGIILYQLLNNKIPYHSNTIRELILEMDTINFQIDAIDFISVDCKDILNNLLIKDVNTRIDSEHFLNHSWFSTNPTKPINIPSNNDNNNNIDNEPIFNNNFHCFSDNDYLIINSPPQNLISQYVTNQPSSNGFSSIINNLKNSIKYFSI